MYVFALLLLVATAWLVLGGTRQVRNVGDFAQFGGTLFGILAPLQTLLVLFVSAVVAASAIAQEKDRRTLVLLLLTRLSNRELVLGKLLASLLQVLVLLAASLPVFMLTALFGGVGFAQIAGAFAVMGVTALAAGSLGATIAFWRDTTFPTLAITVLALVAWLAAGELLAAGVLGANLGGMSASAWAIAVSPWQAIAAAVRPAGGAGEALAAVGGAANLFLLLGLAVAAAANLWAIARLRVWNPPREPALPGEQPAAETIWTQPAAEAPPAAGASRHERHSPHAAAGRARPVWDNPVLWREVRTWAYGRKVLLVRCAYLALFALAAWSVYSQVHSAASGSRTNLALVLAPLFLLSLVLVNAQSVTALTGERDRKALDLLLVTDLSAKEFVFGKLAGALWNTKEMIVLPLGLCGYLSAAGVVSPENAVYLVLALAVLFSFVATLGLHAGMTFENSRYAIGVSLGTVFFLFVGVATCLRILIAFSGAFQLQFLPFAGILVGGGAALFAALGQRNRSTAIGLASFGCPLLTFYVLVSLVERNTLGPFLVTAVTYGFATAALLVPAIYEFDVATGRTTADD